MYIKQIQIQGFKSYRDQTFTSSPFSPAINVIVGRNGSGKSNFFNAIHFVLSDKYSHLRAEERQALLHEGTGRGVMSAFVEITFDNSDNRLPIDKDTVTIKRTIGLKKDEYRVDGKTVSQKEVMNILETAGLSSANPYYIVEQGRVSHLTTMKDHERLDLLKEVAGTKVYDTRRAESVKIMTESELKIKRIDEVIESIEERLNELEREKKELVEFQELDKKRKVLSYHLHDNELLEANKLLDDINHDRQNLHKESADYHLRKQEAHQQMKFIERTIKDQELNLNDLKKQKQILEKQREMLLRERTKTELDMSSMRERLNIETNQKTVIGRELDDLKTQIDNTRREIEEQSPQLDTSRTNEVSIRERLHRAEQRLTQLYSKQGRQTNFASQEERDDWLRQQIAKHNQIMDTINQRVSTLERETGELTDQINGIKNASDEKNRDLEEKKKEMESIQDRYAILRRQRDELGDERKEKWRLENEAEEKLKKVKEELTRAERRLESTLPKSINKGLEEARRIVREQNIQGVYGTVIELFTTKERYYRACEVTAGTALFHLVVESDKVAADILNRMNRQKAKGRITFMPLNRIVSKVTEVPTDPTHTSLLSKLTFDPKFKAVFSRIFGSTFISPNLEAGSDFARNNNVDCVTLKGDQVNKKGALTGGFSEDRESRMDSMNQIKNLRSELNNSTKDSKKTKNALADLDGRINSLVGEMRKLETDMHGLRNVITQNNMELSLMATKISQLQDSLAQKQRNLERSREEQRRQQEEIETLRSELGTPLNVNLTSTEANEVDSLNTQIDTLKRDLRAAEDERISLETRRKMLLSQLNNNLLKRQAELEETYKNLEIARLEPLGTAPDQLERNVASLNSEIDQVAAKIDEIDDSIEEVTKSIKDKQDELDERKTQEQEITRRLETDQNRLEKLLNKRRIVEQRRDTAINQIRELGTIPKLELRNVDVEDKNQLISKLHKVNEKLKKFAHVNKKALDQYQQFNEQRSDFIKKKKELDQGARAINKLIKTLDQKKDEAIERTFKQVSTYFSEIFRELVPGGNARIIMNRRSTDNDSETPTEESSVGAYSGVSISVQFTGDGEAQVMQQLSGGQKSLVALTLIFAIQRCDPAPFYLFDEIDAALDAAYRTSVAQMIHKQAQEKNIQFIIATFKTEVLDYADLFFGISYKNKVSLIRSIEKEEAVRVLQEEEQLQGRDQDQEHEDDVAEDRMED